MRLHYYLPQCFALLFFAGLINADFSWAGGPISVAPDGSPSSWSVPISLHPESGSCGHFSNSQMQTRLQTNVDYWANVTGTTFDFAIITGSITTDVNVDNYKTYFVDSSDDQGLNDSINPVVYDDNGQIVQDIFGSGNQYVVLGFAGPDGFNSSYTTILDGQAFFNCRCLVNPATSVTNFSCASVTFTEADLDFTMTHEIGHMIGLDHTQVNQSLAEGSCNTSSAGDCNNVPAMYPQSVDAQDQISPHRDDEVALLTLYGRSNMTSSTCTLTGTILDKDGNALRCADVQATTSDRSDTLAVVSGIFATNKDSNNDGYTDAAGECLSNCGDFVLRGLNPTKSYTIKVQPIDSQWKGGSSISPCGNGQVSGIVEEQITTITSSNCSASGTIALGNVSTLSTGGVSSGGSSSGSTGSSSESSKSAINCSLRVNSSGRISYPLVNFVFLLLTPLLILWTLGRWHHRSPL